MTAVRYDLHVRFYELDPYGHVNHATYLQYFEAARVDWLGRVELGLDRLQAEGCNLVVTTVACRFVTPALLNERLTIETGHVASRRVRSQWAQVATRDDVVVAAQRINFATVNAAGRPIRMPASLGEAMASIDVGVDWRQAVLPTLAL